MSAAGVQLELAPACGSSLLAPACWLLPVVSATCANLVPISCRCCRYLTYLSTIVASTAANLALISFLQQSHDLALILTASFSVVWSYIAL